MSRLIVKGVPGRYENKHLRDLFKPLGEVTDARIIRTPDGRSRRFGFVGFRTREDAVRARQAMNGAYVETAPVQVEFAHAAGAEAIPRPWSRYSAGSSRYEREHGLRDEKGAPIEENGSIPSKEGSGKVKSEKNSKVNAQFDEFAQASAHRASMPLWADGAIKATEKKEKVESRKTGGKGVMLERKHVTFADADSDDDEDHLYEDLPKQAETHDEEVDDDGKSAVKDKPAPNQLALDSAVSDMDYFKSKIVKDADLEEEEGRNDGNDSGDRSDARDAEEEGDEDPASKKLQGGPTKSSANPTEGSKELEDNEGNSSTEAEDPDFGSRKPDSNKTKETNIPSKKYESDGVNAGETGRLLVRNLAFSVTEEELETSFEPFGALSEVHIVRDKSSGRSRGMAFVQFMIPEQAAKALVTLDGSFHSGRILHVLPAKLRPVDDKAKAFREARATAGSSAFKAEREAARREAAQMGGDAGAQHALHMAADAVADIAADRHGVSKADLFGTARGESGVAAVRLAVAEATIQSETKGFLREHGINLDVAVREMKAGAVGTTAAKRKRMSRTAFLIKNLPARTSESDVMGVFGKFGRILRNVVVPSGALAVVQFSTASDARRAYNSLAYTKFRDTPLYLEWLPSEALCEIAMNNVVANDANGKTEETSEPHAHTEEAKQVENEDVGGDDIQSRRSVYVKNLNFETRDAQLLNHFRQALRKRPDLASSVRSAKVAMKHGAEGKEGEKLSMGFGFVEFARREDALDAIKMCQNTSLDGHALRLQMSGAKESAGAVTRKRRRTSEGAKAKPCAKLMVRNVAFEATRKEIRELFSSFGQLKTVRMPKKVDGSHRGFAFVEFASKNEAKAACEALASTHLYGRHLVIEYASDSGNSASSLEEMQQRAAVDVARKRARFAEGLGDGDEGNGEEGDGDAMIRDELYG